MHANEEPLIPMHFRDSCLEGSRSTVTFYVLAVKREQGQSCSSLSFGATDVQISQAVVLGYVR